ncbi:hypothetical protein [Roseovarius aquimarinus]|uniref:Uncharacterized protein n=1 Tax=Roseovarius aquimarinus TaxID=1229156 RepID=A0ABW7IAP3_9RHOB
MKTILAPMLAAFMSIAASGAFAGPPEILHAEAARDDMGWKFTVTIRHEDTGWDHYANGWDVLAEDGTVLATRTLHHPHVEEQPFTRSLRQVLLPDGTRRVFIRAHCSKGAATKEPVAVEIPL